MRYRRLDAAGDYAFGRGLSDFEQDTPEAVAQAVKTRLALRFGEWFLDTSDGTPWRRACSASPRGRRSTGRFGSGFWGRKASRASTAMYAPLTRTRAHCRFRRTSTRSMARQW